MSLDDLVIDYRHAAQSCAHSNRSLAEARSRLLRALSRRIDVTYEAHKATIADFGLWWLYPAGKLHHTRAVLQLMRLRIATRFGVPQEPTLQSLLDYCQRMPTWI